MIILVLGLCLFGVTLATYSLKLAAANTLRLQDAYKAESKVDTTKLGV